MSGRRAVVAVAVALLAMPGLEAADKAQPKGGGSSGSRSSSASSRSSSSSSSKTQSQSAKSSSSSAKSSSVKSERRSTVSRSRASQAPTTGAQRRHPRPGTGSGRVDLPSYYGYDGYGGYSVKNYGSNPYLYYPPYYARPGYGYGYGYGPYRGGYGYGYGYGYGSSSGYGYAPYASTPYPGYSGVSSVGEEEPEEEEDEELASVGVGMLRILVQPEKARVFVDGNYVGLVDDFDGIMQRLRVPAGRHEIGLRLDGYQTQTFTVDVPEDGTVKVEHKMVRGTGQASSETYAGRPVGYARFEGSAGAATAAPVADTGLLRLAVRPHDASIYVDGAFRGTGSTVSALRLAPGRHRLEVVKPGHRTVERDVDVEAGESAELDVELDRN